MPENISQQQQTGFIDLLDSNNNRIALYGRGSSSDTTTNFSGSFIIPNNFSYAKWTGHISPLGLSITDKGVESNDNNALTTEQIYALDAVISCIVSLDSTYIQKYNAFRRAFNIDSNNYITDGLVLHMDAEDATSSYWASKVGTAVFIPSGTPDLSDGVVFDGTLFQWFCSGVPSNYPEVDNGTVELVYKYTDQVPAAHSVIAPSGDGNYDQNGDISHQSNYIRLAIYPNTGNIYISATRSNKKPGFAYTPSNNIMVISVNDSLGYQNGSALTKPKTDNVGGNVGNTGIVIGSNCSFVNGSTNSYVHMKGNIYQIRVYNRKLTSEEIQYNQSIDIAKYSIGGTA